MSLSIAFRHAFPGRAFDVAIAASTPGVIALFGPSGAGKSTIAAVVAGMMRPGSGHVRVNGVVLADSDAGIFLPPERRRIGMVFQDARLFPHLSVAANLRYGQRRARERRIGWDEVIALLGLADLLERAPASLSGGERQRVAIGRALLSQPRLLIMDEPLASLDVSRRADILPYIASLSGSLALPILYITHAMDEVARLADTLVLIDAGRVIAAGPLTLIAARADLPIGADAQAGAVLDCVVAGHLPTRALTRLALRAGAPHELLVPRQDLPIGQALRARVPASEVIIAIEAPRGISVQNMLPARVAGLVADRGGAVSVELRLGEAPFLARITSDAAGRLALAPGSEVLALIKSVSVQVLA